MLFLVICSLFLILIIRYSNPIFRKLRCLWLASKIHGPRMVLGLGIELAVIPESEFLNMGAKLVQQYPRLLNITILFAPHVLLQDAEDIEVAIGGLKNIKKGLEYEHLHPWLNEGLLLSTGAKWQKRRKLLTPAFHFRILEDSLDAFNKNGRLLVDKLMSRSGEPVDVLPLVNLCTLDTILGKNQRWASHSTLKWEVENPTSSVSEGGKKHRAFLDSMIEYEAENPGSFSRLDIREEVDTFVFEGHDTTGLAITFTLLVLGNYVDIQEKVAAELLEIFAGSERDVSMADLRRMTYLELVIKETLRLYPSVPYFSRALTQDLKLAGDVVIPADCNISICPYLIHRDPRYFPAPEKFDPERFSECSRQNRHPFAYLPFSGGARNCIGQKYAMTEMKIILSTILRRCRLESVTKIDDVKNLFAVVLRPDRPIMMKFTSREEEEFSTLSR